MEIVSAKEMYRLSGNEGLWLFSSTRIRSCFGDIKKQWNFIVGIVVRLVTGQLGVGVFSSLITEQPPSNREQVSLLPAVLPVERTDTRKDKKMSRELKSHGQ